MDFSRQGLEAYGFVGFVPIRTLKAAGCYDIPTRPGVYLVYRETDNAPVFLEESIGGRHKRKDPTDDVGKLARKWVGDARVVYIGKTDKTLCGRVAEYIKCGKGYDHGHWGGRYIWQLEGCDDLLIAWKPTPGSDPSGVESELVKAFESTYGRLPYANIARPKAI